MNHKHITIAVDAMGGENSPYKCLKGIEIFLLRNPEVNIICFGNEKVIKDEIDNKKLNLPNIEIFNTTEDVKDDDNANIILRNRKESSIFLGLKAIKTIPNSGFVSAGNTAALMILSRLNLGMLEGIDRPAICSIIPNYKDFSIMLDLGANITVESKNLLQFAVMGFCYHSILKKNIRPQIGLINIGTEDNKGLDYIKETYELISNSFLKEYFYGFIEPNKIASGSCDVLISDGYTGNIILKTAEGMSNFFSNNLKSVFKKSFSNKLAYKILEKDFKLFKDKINPEKYNGGALLGVNGNSIKSHGSASPVAFSYAIENCLNFISNNLNQKIKKLIHDL